MSSIKEILVKIYAKYVVKKTKKWSKKPVETQEKVMKKLISKAKKTKFGKDHNFDKISNLQRFYQKKFLSEIMKELKHILTRLLRVKKIFYGPENQFTLQKHRAPHLAKNTFQSLKTQCLFILKDLWRQQCIIY